MDYCVLNYDVPQKERSIYYKLMHIVTKIGLPMSQSCYLVPLSHREQIITLIESLDAEKAVTYTVLKFDSSENETLTDMVHTSFKEFVRNTRSSLRKKLEKAESMLAAREISEEKFKKSSEHARCMARARVKKAKHLAALFDLSEDVEMALEATELQKSQYRRVL